MNYTNLLPHFSVISGGQTGADQAGLDAAIALGIKTGGDAPKGWLTRDMNNKDVPDPSLAQKGLVQCSKPGYPARTKANVIASLETVWFGNENSSGGILTIKTCVIEGKDFVINPTSVSLVEWILKNEVTTLNVAGNKLSDRNPEIYNTTYTTCYSAFSVILKHIEDVPF